MMVLLFVVVRAEVPSSNLSTERNSSQFYEKESRRVCSAFLVTTMIEISK